MSEPTYTPIAGKDVIHRWLPRFNYGFSVAIALTTLTAVLDPSLSGRNRLMVVGLGLLLGLWHWRLIIAPPANRCDSRLVVLYLIGAGGLFILLTGLHPVFLFLTFFLYLQLFTYLRLPLAIALSGPLTFLVWWRSAVAGGDPFTPTLELIAMMVVFWLGGAVMASFIGSVIGQSDQRRQLIEELENTRSELARAERQAGIITERQRLAGEIHDTLAQGFASIVMHLEAAEAVLPPGSDAAQHHLDQARHTARDSLGEARRLVWALRPASLEHTSLEQALSRLATRWSAESGVPARVIVAEAAAELHPDIEITLLRAAQEGLANARKHANAGAITLTLTVMPDLVTLDIQDDGVGFDPAALRLPSPGHGGFGLPSMRERVERQGGTVTIESAPGEGTTIAVSLPTLTEPDHVPKPNLQQEPMPVGAPR